MSQNFPLCFEMNLKESTFNFQNLFRHYDYEALLHSLIKVCQSLTFSLRYLYDPSSERRLKLFILINSQEESERNELCLKLFSLLTKGSLSQFFVLDHQDDIFSDLDWINSIGEIVKCNEFVEKPGFTGYLPHLFETSLLDNHFSLLELLDGASYEKLVLEITLKTYDSPDEQALWSNAINDLVTRLSNSQARNGSVRHELDLYRRYQDCYSKGQLFNYSIKALGKNVGDTFAILHTLLEVVSRNDIGRKTDPIVTFNSDDPRFLDSLQATRIVQVAKNSEWDGWQKEPGKSLQHRLIKETISSAGLLNSLDDGSLNFPIVPSNFNETHQPNLSFSSSENSSSSELAQEDLVRGSSPAFSRINHSSLPEIGHLKPLSQITTYQEIVGFLKIFTPLDIFSGNYEEQESHKEKSDDSLNRLKITELIQKHSYEITEDAYIVGIGEDGSPCISNWEKCPHRVVAGTTGAGKTNFLFFLIYQLLYANPLSQIFLADFQAGLHFQIVANQYENIRMVTEVEKFAGLLKELCGEHERRRELMLSLKTRSLKGLKQKSGRTENRTFLIIDEAFFIQTADSTTKKEIEKCLTILASQARVTGIHIVYCSQSPDLLTKQIKACIEERVVLRVANETESFGLLGNHAALGLPSGTAVHRGTSYNPKSPTIVRIPYISDEIWEQPIR
ncbi:FtsK/SpoIIIE domain-containing protein [Phormidesmis sp. 146-33]